MKLRKYEFTPTQWATAKAKITLTDEEGNEYYDPAKVRQVVELGNLVKTPATYDEEGNELTPAVLSTKWSVDILWEGEPLTTSFTSYEVWCAPMGVHTFGSSSAIAEWTQKCKELHPEFFPTPEQIEE